MWLRICAAAANPTFRQVLSELVYTASLVLLPMIDALPHELVRPFARYGCPVLALFTAYLYCENKFHDTANPCEDHGFNG